MKNILFSIFFAFGSILTAQNPTLNIASDTCYLNNQAVGYITKSDGSRLTGIFNSKEARNIFKRNKGQFTINNFLVDKYVLDEKLLISYSKGRVTDSKQNLIATFEVKKSPNHMIIINLATTQADKNFIRYCLVKNGVSPSIDIFFKENKALIREESRRIEREKSLQEKSRKMRFFAWALDRLGGDLDEFEGVYKSIDAGEGVEYEIVLLKSDTDNSKYNSFILSTTGDLKEGDAVFTLENTAQPGLFFAQYSLKSGKTFGNKTATIEGAILSMGIKSFIKMYPGLEQKQHYNEIRPLTDFDASGSGVLTSSNGIVYTNFHVIDGAKRIRICFQNDSLEYEAEIISENQSSDIAMLRITDERFSSDLTELSWSKELKLGQKVFTLGYPITNKMSDNVKVVDGIISGMNGREGNTKFFQTTLPVWYGNSGGPCFNEKGEVLGLATQILFDRGTKIDNVAYITKSENIRELNPELSLQTSNSDNIPMEELISQLIPYSVFIKVNF